MLEIIVWGAQTRSFRQEQKGPTAHTLQQAKAASQAIEEIEAAHDRKERLEDIKFTREREIMIIS